MAKPYGRLYNKNINVSITPLDIKDLYPVGSIYLTVSNINPGDYFGGTWVKVSGGFLYGAVNAAGGTGNGTGTATSASSGNTGSTALNINQIPQHDHDGNRDTFGAGKRLGVWDWAYGADRFMLSTSSGQAGYSITTLNYQGGGQGHTHTLNNHTHNIPYIGVWIWKRTA